LRRLRGPDLIPGVSTDRDRCHYSLTVKPTAFVNLVPVHVIIHKVFLMPADHTIVQSDWLYPLSYVESGKGVTASVELFRRVNPQDFGACECCLPAVGSKICQRRVLVRCEHHVSAFHDWIREVVRDVVPTRYPCAHCPPTSPTSAVALIGRCSPFSR
jgi:Rieske 2Fe-2S family protein